MGGQDGWQDGMDDAARRAEERHQQRVREGRHEPRIVPKPKMDTPTGLFAGACSCGWVSQGIELAAGAWRSAQQHAEAKLDDESTMTESTWDEGAWIGPVLVALGEDSEGDVLLTVAKHAIMGTTVDGEGVDIALPLGLIRYILSRAPIRGGPPFTVDSTDALDKFRAFLASGGIAELGEEYPMWMAGTAVITFGDLRNLVNRASGE